MATIRLNNRQRVPAAAEKRRVRQPQREIGHIDISILRLNVLRQMRKTHQRSGQRAIRHLHETYGPDGYLRVWLPFGDNARNLKKLHTLLADQPRLDGILERIFDEEAGEQKVGN